MSHLKVKYIAAPFVQFVLFSSFHISGILSATPNGVLAIRLVPLMKSYIQGTVEMAVL
jgi:hypothetical protein